MTLASSLSLTACVLEILVGLLSLSFSAAPGWRHLRLFSCVAFTAALYSASSIPQTLTTSAPIIVWASRASLLAAALHFGGWIVYSAPGARGRSVLGRLDKVLLGGLGLVAALSLWPGALAAEPVRIHEVRWLGQRYATAEPTALTDLAFLILFAGMVLPTARYLGRVRDRAPGARAHAVGFGVLLATAVNEGLVAAKVLDAPYVLDVGFLAVVVAVTGEMSRRVVGEARALADLSARLGRMVEERTRALADTRQTLEESERSYHEIFDAAREAIVVRDPRTGLVVDCNRALAEMTGLTREELMAPGAAAFDGEPPYTAAEAAAWMRRAVEEGPQTFEWLGRRKEGTPTWVEVSLTATTILGQPRLLATMRDISARKQVELALRRSEERHRRLLEGMTDAYAAFSNDGRISDANEAFQRLVGYPLAELRELGHRDLTPERWHAPEQRILEEQVLARGSSEVYEKEYRRKDGSVFPAELRTFLIRGDDGRPVGAWAIIRDITARKEAEAERDRLQARLLQSQKLEGLGRLAGGVAHDFNNLLTVILGCADELRRDLADGAPPDPEDAEHIQIAGERARDLTRQLLAFARKQILAPVALDLNALVRESEKLLRSLLGEDVTIRVDLAPDLWPVSGDPGQLEQVILNLALNARDAMPRGGSLAIETRNARVDAAGAPEPSRRAGEWVRIVVRDSGVGMAPEVRAHLFEPFFTTKAPGKGTGLGLATVYGIVEQSGGLVAVESSPGQGTSIAIDLPRAAGAAAKAAPAGARRASGGTETILVVEDEPQVRELTRRALRGGGYRVLAAGCGAEALDLAAEEPGGIDLLVTDVVMPNMDGRALADEMRRRRPKMRVLFVSGYSQDVISHRGVLDSGTEFLPKPFTPPALLARVRSVLDEA